MFLLQIEFRKTIFIASTTELQIPGDCDSEASPTSSYKPPTCLYKPFPNSLRHYVVRD